MLTKILKNTLLLPAIIIILSGFGKTEPRLSPEILRFDLTQRVEVLASDEYGGRMVGTGGIRKAEKYIASEFRRLELRTLPGLDSYFQTFTLYRSGFDYSNTYLKAAESTYRGGGDVVPFSFSGSTKSEQETIFAGYGITAPEYGYDDYAGLDAEGKIVFIFRHEPGEKDPSSPFDGTEHSEYATFASKAENAFSHGAAGLILITDPLNHKEIDVIPPFPPLSRSRNPKYSRQHGVPELPDSFPAVMISERTATPFIAEWGSLKELQRKLESGVTPAEMKLDPVPAVLSVSRYAEAMPVTARNVAGYIPGSGDGWIILGAHHDHLGSFSGSGDTVYNGADDNASGTAAVLETAEYLTSLPEDVFTYNVLFLTFSAEGQGLFGSRHFVESGVIADGDIRMMINLDMIGRNPGRPPQVSIGNNSPVTIEDAEAAAEEAGLTVSLDSDPAEAPSDHLPFLRKGIGVINLHTGLHSDYHQVDDHADKLSYRRMERITRFTGKLILEALKE
ncbi:MAG: M28 family peptidase [Spirochaetia bacterium]